MTAVVEPSMIEENALGNSSRPALAPKDVAVEVVDLVKEFPARRSWLGAAGTPVQAVRGVTFTLRKGEIFGLVGPNGAGKTTLIKVLTTLLEPSGGQARINGMDVIAKQREVRKLVGLVTSNERSFYWRMTGYQNLLFFADIYRLPRKQTLPWIDELVKMLDLQDRIHHRFDAYSTGMRQRLALARGLLNRPEILFMDEPTKGVDPIGSAEIIRLIKQRVVPQWHPMILITSHNLSEIEKLCDRISFMHRGKIIACGTLDELRQKSAPLEQYELVINGLPEAKIAAIAASAGGVNISLMRDQRGFKLIAAFGQGSDGFAEVIAKLIGAGGIVHHCTSRLATIDEVFDLFVAADVETAKNSNRIGGLS